MLRSGDLVAALPAVYCLPEDRDDWAIRIVAASLWLGRDAVFTGAAAARLTFWPDCPVPAISVAMSARGKRSRPGLVIEPRRIAPADILELGLVRATTPSVTAVDLACTALGGDAIDRALRSRTTTLVQMRSALDRHPYRRGNLKRAALLLDSADQPWSEAERLLHRLLRTGGFTKWSTNAWVVAAGNTYCVDVVFAERWLVLKVDGWETHGSRAAFEDDRRRRNHLVLAGYRVLNVTWRQLVDDPDWIVDCVRTALVH